MNDREPVTDVDAVRDLVERLDLPATVEIDELAEKLSRIRGKPINVMPYPETIVAEFRQADDALPYGVWLNTWVAEYIFYRTDTTPSHQRHIILHELGHISCRHLGDSIAQSLGDDGDLGPAEMVSVVKRAGGFAADQERAAESFAYLVERQTRPNLSATGETPAARYRLLED
ncbi:hypothetical protein [Amycolatopsis sp. PS_44_ISF1]|uniref:hypothetical protein n=1 Tax=Amycolatopsis sp. PS_44_ISF1 TaxID=2974917 RepID=UPI0028E04805|nr:hypothetical protein [Amycolatopsis sp. PS_44_ISF1]MDT8910918.1 hypothetical protein [Amycolatopsis sp. PS_44_ISF1]